MPDKHEWCARHIARGSGEMGYRLMSWSESKRRRPYHAMHTRHSDSGNAASVFLGSVILFLKKFRAESADFLTNFSKAAYQTTLAV